MVLHTIEVVVFFLNQNLGSELIDRSPDELFSCVDRRWLFVANGNCRTYRRTLEHPVDVSTDVV